MVFQIAEGGSVAFFVREEMLVDAQHLGTKRGMMLARAALQATEEIALHGGGTEPLATCQATAVDTVEVLLKDHLLKALRGSLTAWHARQRLAKEMAAVQTATLAHLQVQDSTTETPVVVPYLPP